MVDRRPPEPLLDAIDVEERLRRVKHAAGRPWPRLLLHPGPLLAVAGSAVLLTYLWWRRTPPDR